MGESEIALNPENCSLSKLGKNTKPRNKPYKIYWADTTFFDEYCA